MCALEVVVLLREALAGLTVHGNRILLERLSVEMSGKKVWPNGKGMPHQSCRWLTKKCGQEKHLAYYQDERGGQSAEDH
jgi:hypothetical protein